MFSCECRMRRCRSGGGGGRVQYDVCMDTDLSISHIHHKIQLVRGRSGWRQSASSLLEESKGGFKEPQSHNNMCLSQLRAPVAQTAYVAVFVCLKPHFKILDQSRLSADDNGPRVPKERGTEYLKAIETLARINTSRMPT